MYYLIKATRHNGKIEFLGFENFEEIKSKVKNILDMRGWDNKDKVNLKSVESCIEYLTSDYSNVEIKKSKSFKKYLNFKYA